MKREDMRGIWSFLPLLVFLALYVGCGITFTVLGYEDPFDKFPRHVALLAGIAVALLIRRDVKLDQKLDTLCIHAGNPGVMLIGLIYLLAGGFQSAATVMGGKDSVVDLGLSVIPPALLVPGVFLMSCFISTAIGTSMGTIAAMGPIAVGIAAQAELNMALTCAAVIGGAYFGDNLSMISDTTISAAKGVGSEMKDKFKTNFFIAAPAAVVACVLFGVMGGSGAVDHSALSFDLVQVLPYVVVLVTALMGFNVVGVLLLGTAMAGVIGMLQGTITFFDWVQAIGTGMSDMFSITIVAILISGIIGLIRSYGGVDWVVARITGRIRTRRGAEYGIGLLSGVLAAALVNNTIAIIISAPMAKEIGAKYGIAPRRLASLIDIFACAFLSLMPHDGGMLMIQGFTASATGSAVSPLAVMGCSFYTFALLIATCVTIQLGLFRTKEERTAPGA